GFTNNNFSTLDVVKFKDATNHNYRLDTGSPYKANVTSGIALSDDLNDNSRDTTKWNLGTLSASQSAYDPNVAVLEQEQRLVIKPVSNTDAPSHNGYVSANAYDFTGSSASIQVPQVTNGSASTIFAV